MNDHSLAKMTAFIDQIRFPSLQSQKTLLSDERSLGGVVFVSVFWKEHFAAKQAEFAISYHLKMP